MLSCYSVEIIKPTHDLSGSLIVTYHNTGMMRTFRHGGPNSE